ncbi:MAG: hypothetical protein ACTHNP_07110 [Solirubrobacterales bacterium]
MVSRIHSKLGSAGLIVAVVALIAALGGAAFAASGGLSSKQKKEVTIIAKKYAGKPGAPGAPGPQGPAGPQGTPGTAGKDGTNGTNGTNGKSVVAEPAGAVECEEGGTTFEVEGSGTRETVCNGEKGERGEPWAPNNTLPANATETGAYAASPSEGTSAWVPISFNVPLASELDSEHVHIVTEEETTNGTAPAECPGSPQNPEAARGNLCVYSSVEFNATPGSIYTPYVPLVEFGAGTAGAVIRIIGSGSPSLAKGTWAVTG